MTKQECVNFLQDKLMCLTLEGLSCIGKGCDKNCDECRYNYGQGTFGEQKEALKTAIMLLNNIK